MNGNWKVCLYIITLSCDRTFYNQNCTLCKLCISFNLLALCILVTLPTCSWLFKGIIFKGSCNCIESHRTFVNSAHNYRIKFCIYVPFSHCYNKAVLVYQKRNLLPKLIGESGLFWTKWNYCPDIGNTV